MKTTFVLALDPDTALFIEQMRQNLGNEEPNAFINRILRQERDRLTGSNKGKSPHYQEDKKAWY